MLGLVIDWLKLLPQRTKNFLKAHGLTDRWLLGAVVVGFLLGAQGWNWGRFDCLNPDSMAFRTIFAEGRPPFHPGEFLKPPLYTYVNHFIGRLPAMALSSPLLLVGNDVRTEFYFELRLVFGRVFNLLLFSGLLVGIYFLIRSFYSLLAARIVVWILATSAGFVAYQIFLTTDLALVFMMIATLVCASAMARNPSLALSIAGGLLAGLSTATKYNGLAVAAALPLAQLLGSKGNPFLDSLRRPAAWLCGLAVPVGFFLGNPFAIFDWAKFSSDFYYNYQITPVYDGRVAGTGYGLFFLAFPEIFGWPAFLLIALGVVVSLVLVWKNVRASDGWKLWILTLAVFAIYTWKIGGFPRMTTRFVLPMAPFLLLLAAPGLGAILRARWMMAPLMTLLVAYNLVCAFYVGELFRNDPRMKMFPYVEANILGRTTVEASKSIPSLELLSGRKIRLSRMPGGMRRSLLFDDIFRDNPAMQKERSRWKGAHGLEWYSRESRIQRNPDWVAWCSNDAENVIVKQYEAMFEPGSGYEVVFDARTPERPRWVYPIYPDFVINRTTVWKRASPSH